MTRQNGGLRVIGDSDENDLEKKLKEGEWHYRALLNALPAAIYTTDNQGCITSFNDAAVKLWGRVPVLGKDQWCGSWKILDLNENVINPEDCPMGITLREKRPVTGIELIIERQDGSRRYVIPHPQPLLESSGVMYGAVNMMLDITELKSKESALRSSESNQRLMTRFLENLVFEQTQELRKKNEELILSEARYHKMVEEVEDYAIILLDPQGNILNWNKGAEKIKGYSEKEIVGKSFNNFYLARDRENGLPMKLMQEAKDKGKAIHEGWRLRKDGTIFWGSIVLTAIHNDKNEIIGYSKVTRDLTERKLAEDRLKEYNQQLEFQNKELEQFAYAASHDMKEPLRKIHFYNSAIYDLSADKLDTRAREYLSRSIKAVKKMTILIDDILDYSKATGSITEFEEIDLNDVLEEVIISHREETENGDVDFQVTSLPVVYGIPFQIKQLFANLVNNSIKYRATDRKLVIRFKTELVNGIEIQSREIDLMKSYHKISISDNGIGFAQHYAEKIFNIFQRLDTLSGTKGSGIGLAICKKIMQNHHGTITASGKENAGATFSLYFPS